MNKTKLLIPLAITLGQVESNFRRETDLGAEKAIFFFLKNTLIPTTALMSAIYEEHKDEDGFLYMTYSGEDLLFTTKVALGIAECTLHEHDSGDIIIESLPQTWAPYLSTLEKLVSVSESHEDLKERFEGVLKTRTDAFCTLVTCFATKDDLGWVLKLKEFTNFDVKHHLIKMLFPLGLGEVDEIEINVHRKDLLEESVRQIMDASLSLFHGGISVQFKDEESQGYGVLREWLFLVCNQVFDSDKKLFLTSTDDIRRFSPNPQSTVEDKELFRFAGRILSLALKHEIVVGVLLDPLFFKQLSGKTISWQDLILTDKKLHKSFRDMLDMDADTFKSLDCFGLNFDQLCSNAQNIAVTSENRDSYIDMWMEYHYVTQLKDQIYSFSCGFEDMLSTEATTSLFLSFLTLEDLDSMMHGSEEESICVDEWKKYTDYENFEGTDEVICWFWKIVNGMSQQERHDLLWFWTATRFLPRDGFKGLPRLTISKSFGRSLDYPSAQTCLYSLHLPVYEDYEAMKTKVMYVTSEHVRYGFGEDF
ncbi:E3 ubiquitin-protein ligase UPL5 isoform X2 [Eutrema salsugineum]|nr:E3 ubiquitin-protein ligase UPL5 isoform X2 [Eutrema salsugineum]